ncbi:site-specific integrase [Streptosporangium sp. CA-135522]|uniref:site-specific integrase n=1 Tax=Streptosporangium sp. CA-135522 TaxID=3240072 RepID=UPI003D911973
MAYIQRIVSREGRTWTVLGDDYRVVEPIERYLEYLRSTDRSPNTVKSYAKGLELWWTFLERRGQRWDAIGITDVGTFIGRLRRQSVDVDAIAEHPRISDSTVAVRASRDELLPLPPGPRRRCGRQAV